MKVWLVCLVLVVGVCLAVSSAWAKDESEKLDYRVAQLEQKVQYLEERLAAVLQMADHLRYEEGPINSLSGPHIIFSGANVHVWNGKGHREGDINGLGNLFIGYNICPEGYQPSGVCNPMDFGRGGSHNLVIGHGHQYSNRNGFVAGFQNIISGVSVSVSGGRYNEASGRDASISGGTENMASGDYSSVSGGDENTASGPTASVSGGSDNTATGGASSVSGGWFNTATGPSASVSGGHDNTARGNAASVSGGRENVASGIYTSVSAGYGNTASGDYSSVTGGAGNTASGDYASVLTGLYNVASGQVASVSGGSDNTASGFQASVHGGYSNSAGGYYSAISGGNDLVIPEDYPYDYVVIPGIWPAAIWPW